MRKSLMLMLMSIALVALTLVFDEAVAIEEVLEAMPVHSSTVNVFSTPVAYYNGNVYTVNVEAPGKKENGINLHTVVRQGRQTSDGSWKWRKTVIESETLDDPYHTQASIGVDVKGFIHVAYNMHNMPWQYAVSVQPGSISHFIFKGEPLTTQQKKRVKYENKTSFPTMGRAAIPGNQITYPAFFNDRLGRLYVTYRYSVRPDRMFAKRAFAGGVARYDAETGRWTQIGGAITVSDKDALLSGDNKSFVTKPFMFDETWIVYLPRLTFDLSNNMHISWTWRKYGAGRVTKYPSYAVVPNGALKAYRANGTVYQLPIGLADADKVVGPGKNSDFFAHTWPSVSNDGIPSIVVNPSSGSRKLVSYDQNTNRWHESENTPYSASVVMVDDDGKQWAFSTGIRILKMEKKQHKWKQIYLDKNNQNCIPKVLSVPDERFFLVHAHCKKNKVRIFRINWDKQ